LNIYLRSHYRLQELLSSVTSSICKFIQWVLFTWHVTQCSLGTKRLTHNKVYSKNIIYQPLMPLFPTHAFSPYIYYGDEHIMRIPQKSSIHYYFVLLFIHLKMIWDNECTQIALNPFLLGRLVVWPVWSHGISSPNRPTWIEETLSPRGPRGWRHRRDLVNYYIY